MKKILLGLGSISAVAVPVIAIVSCGRADFKHLTNIVAEENTDKIVKAIDKLADAINSNEVK